MAREIIMTSLFTGENSLGKEGKILAWIYFPPFSLKSILKGKNLLPMCGSKFFSLRVVPIFLRFQVLYWATLLAKLVSLCKMVASVFRCGNIYLPSYWRVSLTFTTFWAYLADVKLATFISYLFEKTGFDTLFSGNKNKKNISICCLLKISSIVLSIKAR